MGLTYRQSMEDLDHSFKSRQFNFAGGNLQSLTFTVAAFDKLYETASGPSIVDYLSKKEIVIHEYGCAEGDGCATLATMFPHAHLTGIDLSVEAVKRSMERWPTIDFVLGNWHKPIGQADLIFMSHCLEQMDDPKAVIKKLLEYCVVLVATCIPVRDPAWYDELKDNGMIACMGPYKTKRQFKRASSQVVCHEDNQLLVFTGSLMKSSENNENQPDS